MYDGTSPSERPGETIPLQRARGRARIEVWADGEQTRLSDLYQDGCAKVRLPRVYDGGGIDAVLLNTAGGLTGGDVFETHARCGTDAVLTLTTQACERVYRTAGGEAQVVSELSAGPGAQLHWLPQETILFDGGSLRRSLSVDLEGDATFLGVEALLLGRLASGEKLSEGTFRDSWRVHRDGRLIFAYAAKLTGDIEAVLSGPAVMDGMKAMATVVMAASDTEARLTAARGILDSCPTAGASALDGVLVCRLVAADARELRRYLVPLLSRLADRDLPRVWHL